MTTTPVEPQPDPEVVPSGDPSIPPAPGAPMPGEDPGTIEDPEPPQTEPAPAGDATGG